MNQAPPYGCVTSAPARIGAATCLACRATFYTHAALVAHIPKCHTWELDGETPAPGCAPPAGKDNQ